ncbi:23S rRNA (pseudouridine(1915)-N(3))-methyltransferase RlmH [Silvibacterium acidisoli]|uniref:23S rRNA (pseudouridine(1915)-N(3))-methyltransferase RlmH n=1 Tax=Acidobacteriaceae bacterium ZG23-2 TaxID=2883246 RepID=UPI00406C2199
MRITLVAIAPRSRSGPFEELSSEYLSRLQPYAPAEAQLYRTSAAFFEATEKQKARTSPVLVLLDPRGKQLSSEQLAQWISRQRDEGQQQIVFAIGPADGWSDEERRRATLLWSFGPLTLPHELARVVLSEQVYRAFTIMNGHPYHCGH